MSDLRPVCEDHDPRVFFPNPRPAKVDDRERCPVCRRPQNPLPSGFLRKHNDPQGYPCSNRRRATTTETRTA